MKEKVIIIKIFCTTCGEKLNFQATNDNKLTAGIGGILGGAMLGSKIGIAMGALGAIAGTIPVAIIGGVVGANLGLGFDSPQCNKCGNKIMLTNDIIKNAQKTEFLIDTEDFTDIKNYKKQVDDFFYKRESELITDFYKEYLDYKELLKIYDTFDIPKNNKFINNLFYNSLYQIDLINKEIEYNVIGTLKFMTIRKKNFLINKFGHNNYYKILFNIAINERAYVFLAERRMEKENKTKGFFQDIEIRGRRVSYEESLQNHLHKCENDFRFIKNECRREMKLW